MANTIRIKRSTGSSAPTSLSNAELAYAEGSNILYYGTGTGGAGGSATSIEAIGGDGYYSTLTSAQTISGNKTYTGTLDFSGATVQSFTCAQNLIVSGNLTVSGTTTTVDSTTVSVADINLNLAKGAANDSAANGGGITVESGDGNKTWNWVNSTDAWTSSEHIDLASSKAYYINGTSVLSSTTLGSNIVNSSLTALGTIGTGVWAATDVAIAHGGTGASTATAALTNLGFSAYGKTLIDDADAAAARTTLGLSSMATQAHTSVNIDGGTIDGITIDGGTY